jgi:uncharacterized protein (TIGR03437 family)
MRFNFPGGSLRITRRELLAAAAGPLLSGQSNSSWQTALAGWTGVRPRLMMDAKKLADIRAGLNTTYAAMWKRVSGQIALIRSMTPPAYTVSGTNDLQLWQRDNADAMIYLAFVYLATGDPSYLSDCLKWVGASCSYPAWGTGGELNNNLAAGHQLFGLAIVYDWLHDVLDSSTLSTVRQTLIARAPYMYNAALNPATEWARAYVNSHFTTEITGLFAAALTLFDDPGVGAQALQWIDPCRTKMQTSESFLWPDGASLEGLTYWDYDIEYKLKFYTMSQMLLNEGPTSPYFAQAPWYRIYLTAPYNTWNYQTPNHMDLGDCSREMWYGPSPHIRQLGALTKNPYAQWYADNMASKGVDRYNENWLNFMWYDSTLPAQSPVGLPTMRYFNNMGIVASRSDWSGSESIVTFKSGPPCGLSAIQQANYDMGSGHAHPDANHFLLFGNNEFLVRDDGYLSLKKTENHNTLLVNGQGQMGEGSEFFVLDPYLLAKTYASILKAESHGNLDYFVGEAAPAYPASSGVRQFTRHILYLKPSAVIVFDDIQLAQSSPMELRFHTEASPSLATPGVFLAKGANGVVRMELLTPTSVSAHTGTDAVTDSSGNKLSLSSIRLQRTDSSWRNVMAFSWGPLTPATITIVPTAGGYTVSLDSRKVSFLWDQTSPAETTPVPLLRNAQPVLPAFDGNVSVGFASNGYAAIYGTQLASQTLTWSGADFDGANAPKSLAGTEVRVNGIAAAIYYVSPTQINVNLPDDKTVGAVEVQVFNNGVPSNIVTVNRASVAPAMLTTSAFTINGRRYVVALLPTSTQSGPFVGPANLISGVPFQPVKPGDAIVLYVLGAGPTNPVTQAGVVASASAKVASSYMLRIGGVIAPVDFFGIVVGSIGLYQLNARVPNVPPGDQMIELTVGGVTDQQNLYLAGVIS